MARRGPPHRRAPCYGKAFRDSRPIPFDMSAAFQTGLVLLRPSLWWDAAMYGLALWLLDVPPVKAAVVFLLIFGYAILGRRSVWVSRFATLLLAVAVAVWIGVLPHPADWYDILAARFRGPA